MQRHFFTPTVSSEGKNLQGPKLKLISLESSTIIIYDRINSLEFNQIWNCSIRQWLLLTDLLYSVNLKVCCVCIFISNDQLTFSTEKSIIMAQKLEFNGHTTYTTLNLSVFLIQKDCARFNLNLKTNKQTLHTTTNQTHKKRKLYKCVCRKLTNCYLQAKPFLTLLEFLWGSRIHWASTITHQGQNIFIFCQFL